MVWRKWGFQVYSSVSKCTLISGDEKGKCPLKSKHPMVPEVFKGCVEEKGLRVGQHLATEIV